jgi:hypothetical protein
MDGKTELPVLADLMALKIEGPAIVFLRPRARWPAEKMEAVAQHLLRIGSHTGVTFVLVEHDVDIMAAGDVDLERCGLTRLPSLEPA